MTNHWVDLQHCKTILVEGSNVAENHPMAFKWIRKAQDNGAKIIHVDPRFTRSLFAMEVLLGGVLPLAILSRSSLRARPGTLFNGALLTTLGVILNRVSVVYLAMRLRGAMPQNAPETYFPSIFEWGVSIGLIAASVFLFGLGARLFPLLPREGAGRDLVT
jgi:Ni/Fe-hydrogenase subunit HybB-like protein